jgi:hypothetical protein
MQRGHDNLRGMVRDPSKREGLSAVDAKFLQSIEKFGWHVMRVVPHEGEQGDSFAYSTGLFYSFGHPEVILFNLPLSAMTTIVNTIGRIVKSGQKFAGGLNCGDLLNNYECAFRAVDLSHYREYLGFSLWFYEGPKFPALQVFWPDKFHHFPWDSACTKSIREAQPLLYLPAPAGLVQ